jgi:HEAT repeat protein
MITRTPFLAAIFLVSAGSAWATLGLLHTLPVAAKDEGSVGAQEKKSQSQGADSAAAAQQAARDILAKFDKSANAKQTQTRTGRLLHMECLVALAKAGPATVPVLVDAIKTGSPDSRALAAEALGFLGDANAKSSLAQQVEAKDWGVRINAIKSLGRLGLEATPKYRQIAEKDASVGIRFEMTFALARDDKPAPEAIRNTLSSYDVKRMHSTRYGKAAPDFALPDTTGKVWRLRDLRDKKSCVLVFLAGTT